MFQDLQHTLFLLGCFLFWTQSTEGSIAFHISEVIEVFEEIEKHKLGSSATSATELLRKVGGYENEYYQHLLGEISVPNPDHHFLTEEQLVFIKSVMSHDVKSQIEYGTVLSHDGTSVAIGPLICGIEAGLKRQNNMSLSDVHQILTGTVDNLFAATLTKDLGLAFLLFHMNLSQAAIASDGCWDSIPFPKTFTLLDPTSAITNAFINGGVDGVILGNYFTENRDQLPKISSILRDYYGGKGLDGNEHMRSNFRRRNFGNSVTMHDLRDQLKNSLNLYKYRSRDPILQTVENRLISEICEKGIEEFQRVYLVCPAIIPRCMWEAKPMRGTPIYLNLPLKFVYIHHTYEPSRPCRTFPDCAANMRSMQKFHQEDRDWQDIGYNFVVGSDGYLYEGRGWFLLGTHTKWHNSKGYGVSFIGNYTSELPEIFALELVKENFLKCAVRGSKIVSNFTIHGHRQLRATSCPGEELYQLIKTWDGFQEVQKMDQALT